MNIPPDDHDAGGRHRPVLALMLVSGIARSGNRYAVPAACRHVGMTKPSASGASYSWMRERR